MLISSLCPPLAPLEGVTGEPAMMPPVRLGVNGLRGLGQDPFSLIAGGILGPIESWFQSQSQNKLVSKQLSLEQQQLKEQKLEDARGFAQQQAQALTQPADTQRQDQMVGLILVGGGALLLSAILIMGAVKARKNS